MKGRKYDHEKSPCSPQTFRTPFSFTFIGILLFFVVVVVVVVVEASSEKVRASHRGQTVDAFRSSSPIASRMQGCVTFTTEHDAYAFMRVKLRKEEM